MKKIQSAKPIRCCKCKKKMGWFYEKYYCEHCEVELEEEEDENMSEV